jgi:hypothetical protein
VIECKFEKPKNLGTLLTRINYKRSVTPKWSNRDVFYKSIDWIRTVWWDVHCRYKILERLYNKRMSELQFENIWTTIPGLYKYLLYHHHPWCKSSTNWATKSAIHDTEVSSYIFLFRKDKSLVVPQSCNIHHRTQNNRIRCVPTKCTSSQRTQTYDSSDIIHDLKRIILSFITKQTVCALVLLSLSHFAKGSSTRTENFCVNVVFYVIQNHPIHSSLHGPSSFVPHS